MEGEIGSLRRIDGFAPEAEAKFQKCMEENTPAVVYNFGPPSCLRTWCTDDGSASCAITQLRKNFGDARAPVVVGGVHMETYGAARVKDMSILEYLDWLGGNEDYPEIDRTKQWLYLKDWHFVREYRERRRLLQAFITRTASCDSPMTETAIRSASSAVDSEDYETPSLFADDWLNWWWEARRGGADDYRFVYVGPAGSLTPLHHDVLRSYSWSANLCGAKRWTLFPPAEGPKLHDRLGNLAPDCRAGKYDAAAFPLLEKAPRCEVLQGPGEAIFVPSGWFHQVENMGDGRGGPTASVNHNWFNHHCLRSVSAFMRAELLNVRRSIEDLREGFDGEGPRAWERQCEVVMRANSAMNVSEFFALVSAKAQELLRVFDVGKGAWADAGEHRGYGEVDAGDGGGADSGGSSGGDEPAAAAKSGGASAAAAFGYAYAGVAPLPLPFGALAAIADVVAEIAEEPCCEHLFVDIAEEAAGGPVWGVEEVLARVGAALGICRQAAAVAVAESPEKPMTTLI
ncbi:unnamed protein product [Phaeothamnion confervicola]